MIGVHGDTGVGNDKAEERQRGGVELNFLKLAG